MHGEGLTNAGKKEARQFNQVLDKEVKEGRQGVKEARARTSAKVHRTRGQKTK